MLVQAHARRVVTAPPMAYAKEAAARLLYHHSDASRADWHCNGAANGQPCRGRPPRAPDPHGGTHQVVLDRQQYGLVLWPAPRPCRAHRSAVAGAPRCAKGCRDCVPECPQCQLTLDIVIHYAHWQVTHQVKWLPGNSSQQ